VTVGWLIPVVLIRHSCKIVVVPPYFPSKKSVFSALFFNFAAQTKLTKQEKK
jgi:hypothetical protein